MRDERDDLLQAPCRHGTDGAAVEPALCSVCSWALSVGPLNLQDAAQLRSGSLNRKGPTRGYWNAPRARA